MVYLYSFTHPRNQLFGSSSIFQQVRRVLPSGVVNGGRGEGGGGGERLEIRPKQRFSPFL